MPQSTCEVSIFWSSVPRLTNFLDLSPFKEEAQNGLSIASSGAMRILIFLFCWLLTLSASAGTKGIVFNLDGTLIQGIPKRNHDRFTNKDQMFSVSLNGQTKYFYVIPFAAQLLGALQAKDDLVIHIISKHSKPDTDGILSKIKLPPHIGGTLADIIKKDKNSVVLTIEDAVGGKVDLSKITKDFQAIPVFTNYVDILLPDQKRNEVVLGKPYFYFESFDQADAELKASPQLSASIPASKRDWDLDQGKLALIWQVLVSADYLVTPDILGSILKLKINTGDLTDKGLDAAQVGFADQLPKWVFSTDKKSVIGCKEFSVKLKTLTRDLTQQDCLDYYGTKFTFSLNEQAKTITGCVERDEASSAIIQSAPSKECIEASEGSLKNYWQGKQREKCVSYLQESYFFREENKSACKDDHVITENGKLRFVSLYFDGKDYVEGISEILSLPRGGTVPPSVYQKFSTGQIAQALIKYIQQTREQGSGDVKNPSYDFFRDTRIMMALNSNLFEYVRTGGFLNQHETNSSKGYLGPTTRATTEDAFLGIQLERPYGTVGKPAHKVRPKYTYLLLDAPHAGMGDTNITSQYGNIFFKFKDAVKSRSTFTPGDSLGLNGKGISYNGSQSFYYRSTQVMPMRDVHYWETQIWGELKLSDVDYVLVNCPAFAPLTTAEIENIKKERLKVFQCLVVRNPQGSVISLSKGAEF